MMTVNLLTSGVVLSLTCAAFITYEILHAAQKHGAELHDARRDHRGQLHGGAGVSNQGDATEVLAALKTDKR